MQWSLTQWQIDPGLATVRDPANLAKLPAVEREEWQRLWADVAAVIATDPVEQGRAHAARREWAKAIDHYARGLARGQTGEVWFEYAAQLLLSGDPPGYVKACDHLVDRVYGKPGGFATLLRGPRACTLAPDAVTDMFCCRGRLAEEGTPGLPRVLVPDRTRRLGVPSRPVPGGGAALRAESAGQPQAGARRSELEALPGWPAPRSTSARPRKARARAGHGPEVARSVWRRDAGPRGSGGGSAPAQLAGGRTACAARRKA